MASLNKREIKERLARKDFEAYQYILKQQGATLYSLCHYLCLNIPKFEQELFKNVLKSAIKNLSLLDESTDVWLYHHLHKEWLVFAKKNGRLQAQSSNLSFDWSRPMGRQSEDALELLSPAAREIFLYRFFIKFPLSLIQKITDFNEKRVAGFFDEAINKVSAL